jgi:hypothetical protein
MCVSSSHRANTRILVAPFPRRKSPRLGAISTPLRPSSASDRTYLSAADRCSLVFGTIWVASSRTQFWFLRSQPPCRCSAAGARRSASPSSTRHDLSPFNASEGELRGVMPVFDDGQAEDRRDWSRVDCLGGLEHVLRTMISMPRRPGRSLPKTLWSHLTGRSRGQVRRLDQAWAKCWWGCLAGDGGTTMTISG